MSKNVLCHTALWIHQKFKISAASLNRKPTKTSGSEFWRDHFSNEAKHLLAVEVSREPEPITQSHGCFITPELPDPEGWQEYMGQKNGDIANPDDKSWLNSTLHVSPLNLTQKILM